MFVIYIYIFFFIFFSATSIRLKNHQSSLLPCLAAIASEMDIRRASPQLPGRIFSIQWPSARHSHHHLLFLLLHHPALDSPSKPPSAGGGGGGGRRPVALCFADTIQRWRRQTNSSLFGPFSCRLLGSHYSLIKGTRWRTTAANKLITPPRLLILPGKAANFIPGSVPNRSVDPPAGLGQSLASAECRRTHLMMFLHF